MKVYQRGFNLLLFKETGYLSLEFSFFFFPRQYCLVASRVATLLQYAPERHNYGSDECGYYVRYSIVYTQLSGSYCRQKAELCAPMLFVRP